MEADSIEESVELITAADTCTWTVMVGTTFNNRLSISFHYRAQSEECHRLGGEVLQRQGQHDLGAVARGGGVRVVSLAPVSGLAEKFVNNIFARYMKYFHLGDGAEEDGWSGHDEGDDAAAVGEELGPAAGLAGQHPL